MFSLFVFLPTQDSVEDDKAIVCAERNHTTAKMDSGM